MRVQFPPGALRLGPVPVRYRASLSASSPVLAEEKRPERVSGANESKAASLMWYMYIINKDGMLYTGIAQDLNRRLEEHKRRSCLVGLLYKEEFPDKFQAAKREKQIKGWTRRKKLALIDGNIELLRKL